MTESNNQNKSSKIATILKEILTGDIFSKQFFARQIWVIVLTVILSFFYMNNRMICEQSYKEIHRLRKELTNEKYISVYNESKLLQISRIGTIKELVNKHQLNLVEENMPAYKINMTKPETDNQWNGFPTYGYFYT